MQPSHRRKHPMDWAPAPAYAEPALFRPVPHPQFSRAAAPEISPSKDVPTDAAPVPRHPATLTRHLDASVVEHGPQMKQLGHGWEIACAPTPTTVLVEPGIILAAECATPQLPIPSIPSPNVFISDLDVFISDPGVPTCPDNISVAPDTALRQMYSKVVIFAPSMPGQSRLSAAERLPPHRAPASLYHSAMIRGWVRHRIGEFQLEGRWEVDSGSVLVLFGPSGSGKTMTLRAIAGLVQPDEGEIAIADQPVFDSAENRWTPPHRRRVGYVPQDDLLFPHLDVAGNIAYGLHAVPRPQRQERVAQLIDTYRLAGLEHRRIWEISGGQRQRVSLARALAPQPAALLLDEPFSALDIELRRTLRAELRGILRAANIPIILVTHDREEALALGDIVQVLDEGRIAAQGDPVNVLGHPTQDAVARLVGVENLLSMTVEQVNAQAGTMVCVSNGVQLTVPLHQDVAGDEISVGVRSDEIILASEEPRGLSARNILRGLVQTIEPRGAGYDVLVDCGLPIVCHITQSARDDLSVDSGATMWIIIKASSCFLVRPE